MNTLSKLRNGYTKLVAINRLPSELLASIFLIAVDAGRATRPRRIDKETPLDFLNVICSVSTYWRHVALATPELWADITLAGTGGLNHAALWLERSRSCPLHVRFLRDKYSDCEREMIDLAEHHSSRFKSLVICLLPDIGQKIFDASVQRSKASVDLETLAVSVAISRGPPDLKETNSALRPRIDKILKPVRTLYVRYNLFDGCTLGSFHDLTSLSLYRLNPGGVASWEELLGVLRASPSLHSLELSSVYLKPPPQPDTSVVNLPSLKILHLRHLPVDLSEWILGCILPHSDGLTLARHGVSGHGREATIGFERLFSIPDRVKALYSSSYSSATIQVDLSGLLKSLTRLETLALKDTNITVAKPTWRSDNGECPALAALDMVSCRVKEEDAFKSMLSRHSVRRLRMFECQGRPTMHELAGSLPKLIVSEEPAEFLSMFSPFD